MGPEQRPTSPASFTRGFVREMLVRIGLALGAMVLSVAGARLLRSAGEWGEFTGATVGLSVGIVIMVGVLRRRR